MKNLKYFFFVFLMSTSFSQKIVGIVVSKEGKKPLVGVNVYLSGTSIGDATDKDGKYEITNPPKGKFQLTSSMVGYKTVSEEILIDSDKTIEVNFIISEKIYELPELKIVALSPAEREKAYKKFIEYFIGVSENAEKCKIINNEDLDFYLDEDTDEIIVAPKNQLFVVNEALGYKILADLKTFKFFRNRYGCQHQITTYFMAIKPDDDEVKLDWEKERERAYKGSLLHFVHSCAKGKLFENGFKIIDSVGKVDWDERMTDDYGFYPESKVDSISQVLIKSIDNKNLALDLTNPIIVCYCNEEEEDNYVKFKRQYRNLKYKSQYEKQTSWLNSPTKKIDFGRDGSLKNIMNTMIVFGYWAWEALADKVPYEYISK